MTVSDRSAALDSNLLLLFIASQRDQLIPLIGRWKRLDRFSRNDAIELLKLVAGFRSLLTTPHVLTETSNFIGQLLMPARTAMLQALAEHIARAEERHTVAQQLVEAPVFLRLRLTDTALLDLPSACTLLTMDNQLYIDRMKAGGLAKNFNHLLTS